MKIIFSNKINLKTILYTLGGIFGCLSVIGFLILSNRGYFVDKGKPMLDKDTAYLCEKLEIKHDPVCAGNQDIYPEDFSTLLTEKFETGIVTYQDVQIVLEPYQASLDVNNDFGFFVVDYDLNQDGVFDLRIKFEGTVENNLLDGILFREEIGF